MIGFAATQRAGSTSSSPLELRHASTDRAIFVTVPARRFIAIDGIGHRSSSEFLMASRALRAAHSRLLDHLRRRRVPASLGRTVAECLWEPTVLGLGLGLRSALADLSQWRWRQLLEIPAAATDDAVLIAIEEARRTGTPAGGTTRPWAFVEGPVAQWLHLGQPAQWSRSVVRLGAAARRAGWTPVWPLHELLLADPREVPNGHGRTIIRLPLAARAVDADGASGDLAGDQGSDGHPWRNHSLVVTPSSSS